MGFWKDVGGSLINGATGLITGLFGLKNTSDTNEANLKAVQDTNKANRELAQYNWQQQIDMWNRQNEYNSPISQMTRLKEAGLNPNLVYGNGVTGNTSGSAPSPTTPTMQAPHFEKSDYGFIAQSSNAAYQSYLQSKNLNSELEVRKEEIQLKRAQQSAIESQNLERTQKIAESMMRTSRGWFEYDMANKLKDSTLEAAALNVSNLKNKFEMDRYRIDELMPLEKEKMQITNALLAANVNLTVRQAEKIQAEIWKISEEVVNFGVQRGLWASQTRLNNANSDRVDLSTSFDETTFNTRVASVSQDLTNAFISGDLKSLERSWKIKYGFSTDQMSQLSKTIAHGLEQSANLIGSFF